MTNQTKTCILAFEMGTVQEIEQAISELPSDARERLFARLLVRFEGDAKAPSEERREIKVMDRKTFEASSKRVMHHYKPLLKALSE